MIPFFHPTWQVIPMILKYFYGDSGTSAMLHVNKMIRFNAIYIHIQTFLISFQIKLTWWKLGRKSYLLKKCVWHSNGSFPLRNCILYPEFPAYSRFASHKVSPVKWIIVNGLKLKPITQIQQSFALSLW